MEIDFRNFGSSVSTDQVILQNIYDNKNRIEGLANEIKDLKELSNAQTNILTDIYDILKKLLDKFDVMGINKYSLIEEMINKIKNDDESL